MVKNIQYHTNSELKIVMYDDLPKTHCHRVVFLAEIPPKNGGSTSMLELVEIVETVKEDKPNIEIKDHIIASTFYKVGARMFEDQVNWFPKKDEWEIWKIINATEDTPISCSPNRFSNT